MYSEDPASGTILLSMATDSSCRNGLRSPEEGAETYLMRQVHDPPAKETQGCSFPQWAHGKWTNLEVTSGHVTLRDDSQYRTIDATCLNEDPPGQHGGDRFLVHGRAQW